MYEPAAAKAYCAMRDEDNDVSQVPSDSQSQRACNVAFGSESEDEDASNVTVVFTYGMEGEWTNRAVGPAATIVTATAAEWTRAPLVPVIVTAYDPTLVPVIAHADVPFGVTLAGEHEVVTPEGTEARSG